MEEETIVHSDLKVTVRAAAVLAGMKRIRLRVQASEEVEQETRADIT